MPEPLEEFCAHVSAYEVLMMSERGRPEGFGRKALIDHPGSPYPGYVRRTYAELKAEQFRLLRLTTTRSVQAAAT